MKTVRFNRKITVQRATDAIDAAGQRVKTWATFKSFWANKAESPGPEGFESDQLTASKIVTFIIRFNETITEKDRILFNSQYYDIKSIIDRTGSRQYTELTCEVKDNGNS